MIIDIFDWDMTYAELVDWISETGAELIAVHGFGINGVISSHYEFREERDYIAFKLKFKKL